jgi:hypothetical protein
MIEKESQAPASDVKEAALSAHSHFDSGEEPVFV